ncbi:MAG: TadE/TadG family type IV pilus assembly protein [Hyphomicrobium sp.]
MRCLKKLRAGLAAHATTHARLRRLGQNEDGTTAIEFAIVAVPFFMFIFGLMGVSSYFFIMTSLEKGMDQSSRLIRTGQAQTADAANHLMTVDEFKQSICTKAGSWVKCGRVQVFVQKFAEWDDVAPQPCLSAGGATVNTASGSDPIATYAGASNDIVLVTTCYKWDFPMQLGFMSLGQMADGSMMMQTATAFRTEPYAASN